MAKVNEHRAIRVLVESLYFGDAKVAKSYGISVRTISNYRIRLNTDNEFLAKFELARKQFESDWAANIPSALIAGVEYLIESFGQVDKTDPLAIKAVSDAVKTLAEISLVRELLNVRLDEYYRQNGHENNQIVTQYLTNGDADN